MRITWTVRVAAALVLAAFLQGSDGNAFWSATLPALLTAGALALAVAMLVLSRARPKGRA
jgi:hypothetical protein